MPLPRSTAGSTSPRPRATWQRAAVHDILERTDGFRSAQQIHSALEAEGTKARPYFPRTCRPTPYS